jgi:hypothetical protein
VTISGATEGCACALGVVFALGLGLVSAAKALATAALPALAPASATRPAAGARAAAPGLATNGHGPTADPIPPSRYPAKANQIPDDAWSKTLPLIEMPCSA